MKEENQYNQEPGSGFVSGLLFGAIIGAIVAIIVYRRDKSEVIKNFAEKIEKYFSNIFTVKSPEVYSNKKAVPVNRIIATKPQKISVDIPSTLESIDTKLPVRPKTKKMFVKH